MKRRRSERRAVKDAGKCAMDDLLIDDIKRLLVTDYLDLATVARFACTSKAHAGLINKLQEEKVLPLKRAFTIYYPTERTIEVGLLHYLSIAADGYYAPQILIHDAYLAFFVGLPKLHYDYQQRIATAPFRTSMIDCVFRYGCFELVQYVSSQSMDTLSDHDNDLLFKAAVNPDPRVVCALLEKAAPLRGADLGRLQIQVAKYVPDAFRNVFNVNPLWTGDFLAFLSNGSSRVKPGLFATLHDLGFNFAHCTPYLFASIKDREALSFLHRNNLMPKTVELSKLALTVWDWNMAALLFFHEHGYPTIPIDHTRISANDHTAYSVLSRLHTLALAGYPITKDPLTACKIMYLAFREKDYAVADYFLNSFFAEGIALPARPEFKAARTLHFLCPDDEDVNK